MYLPFTLSEFWSYDVLASTSYDSGTPYEKQPDIYGRFAATPGGWP
jgi:hypothetical protein